MGPPGSGKGTQAKILAVKLDVSHVASGDLFRYHQREGTPLGLKAKEYMAQGLLVPDDVTVAMVMEQVLPPKGQGGFLLDGFPRNLAQARALADALAQGDLLIDQVVLMRVPQEELVKRLGGRWICRTCQTPYNEVTATPEVEGRCDSCGGELYQRQDDTMEAVRTRIRVYREETEPLLEFYRDAGVLAEVDGVGSVDEVGRSLREAVGV